MNLYTILLATHLALQFGQALLHLIHAIIHSNPSHGPVYMIKIDLADGFYCIHIAPTNIPLLRESFPMLPQEAALIASPGLTHGMDQLPHSSAWPQKPSPTWPMQL